MSSVQRRRWDRFRKTLDVVIIGSDDVELAGNTQDICEGGIGIICKEALQVGEEYRFVISAISDTPLVGMVRWCTPSPARGANIIGVELTAISGSQTEAIADSIARWKADDAGGEHG